MGAGFIRQRSGEVEQELLIVPPEENPQAPLKPLPLIVWAHAGTKQEYDISWSAIHLLTRAGFLIVSGDWAGALNWGNDAAIAQINEAIQNLRANNFATDDPVITAGASMGNVTALNWALQNSSDWQGHICVAGAWDVDQFHAENRWDLAASIDAAYEGSWTAFPEKDQHSPMRYIDTLKPVPMYHLYGTADTAIPEAESLSAIANWPGPVTDIEIIGGNHSTTGAQTDRPALKQWIEAFNTGDAFYIAPPTIVSRAEWGADETLSADFVPDYYPLQSITLHHTGTARNVIGTNYDAYMRSIQQSHVVDRGWDDIGYQILIAPDGTIYEGRKTDGTDPGHEADTNNMVTGAHTGGWNSGNFGVCLMGDFTQEWATAAQMQALEYYLAYMCNRHELDPQGTVQYTNPVNAETAIQPTITEHNSWPNTATECAGTYFRSRHPRVRYNVAVHLGTYTLEDAQPASLAGLTPGPATHRVGPYRVASGELVTVAMDVDALNWMIPAKSSDNGLTWHDYTPYRKGNDPNDALAIAYNSVTGIIHTAFQDSAGYAIWKPYDPANDTWPAGAILDTTAADATRRAVDIVAREDNDTLLVLYQGTGDRTTGSRRDAAGDWGKYGNLDYGYESEAAGIVHSPDTHNFFLHYTDVPTGNVRTISVLSDLTTQAPSLAVGPGVSSPQGWVAADDGTIYATHSDAGIVTLRTIKNTAPASLGSVNVTDITHVPISGRLIALVPHGSSMSVFYIDANDDLWERTADRDIFQWSEAQLVASGVTMVSVGPEENSEILVLTFDGTNFTYSRVVVAPPFATGGLPTTLPFRV